LLNHNGGGFLDGILGRDAHQTFEDYGMKRFGLFGRSLSHSFSKSYFEHKFKNEGIVDCSYDLFEVEDSGEIMQIADSLGLNGFNVTIPFKEDMRFHLANLAPEVEEIGAVNCVKRSKNGQLVGYNTDSFGFWNSIKGSLDLNKVNKAVVLGSGGASKAITHALSANNIEPTIVSRSGELNYNNLHAGHIRESYLIVNCTPLGTSPRVKEFPDIPYEALTSAHVAFDVVYNPPESAFLRKCGLSGSKTINGLRMLELQAEHSWAIWNS